MDTRAATSAFIVVTLAAIGHSLWVRRDTWWSRWEAAVSLALALEGAALVLMSPWSATELNPLLYRAVRLWNVPEVLGHLCLVAAIGANIYHALVRLTDPARVRTLMRRHVAAPTVLTATAMLVLFVKADAGYHRELFTAAVTNPWLAGYVVLGSLLVLYLSGYVSRAILALRADPRAKTTADLYLASMAAASAACTVLVGSIWLDVDAAVVAWAFLCLSVGIFAYGSTKSWQEKAMWFTGEGQDRSAG